MERNELMVFPMTKDHSLVQKDIKHARIRVSENGHVRIVVPNSFTAEDIESLLKKKKKWIESNRERFQIQRKLFSDFLLRIQLLQSKVDQLS